MIEPFLGMVQYFGCNFAPVGYIMCEGQIVSISQYSALFSLLGVSYGGNGTSNFGLPDLRGRSMIGKSNSNVMGEQAGTENTVVTMATMPVHTHTSNAQIACFSTDTNSTTPVGTYAAIDASGKGAGTKAYNNTGGAVLGGALAVTVGNAGTASAASFSNLAPYLALTCTISMMGTFPPRS